MYQQAGKHRQQKKLGGDSQKEGFGVPPNSLKVSKPNIQGNAKHDDGQGKVHQKEGISFEVYLQLVQFLHVQMSNEIQN
jgi:hypothetical protein